MKDFVSYELAVKLKTLGFNWPCYVYIYTGDTGNNYDHYLEVKPSDSKDWNGKSDLCVSRPTFSQAFRWFRDNYNLFCEINVDKTMEPKFAFTIKEYESTQFLEGFGEDVLSEYLYYKHEEAELACLQKLVEIVEENKLA
jgi:hypothetical protein